MNTTGNLNNYKKNAEISIKNVSILISAGSVSYSKAVEDLKRFFPEGLCSKPNSDLQFEQVSSVMIPYRKKEDIS